MTMAEAQRPAWRETLVRTWPAWVLGGFVATSRLAFAGRGYGVDPDGWSVVSTARDLAATGVYTPSRFPGYPLPEFFDAALVKLGLGSPLGLALPSIAMSIAASVLLYTSLSNLGRRRAFWAAFAFSVVPAIWTAGLADMDYLWGAAFYLAAAVAARRERLFLAALALGLAAASRPTYAVGFIPIAVFFVGSSARPDWPSRAKGLIVLALVSGAVAGNAYAPLFLRYGLGFLTFADHGVDAEAISVNLSVMLFGVIGSAAVIVATGLAGMRLVQAPSIWPRHRSLLTFAGLNIGLFGLLFLRLPDEATYLLPAVIGLCIAFAVILKPLELTGLALALLVSCFGLNVERSPSGGPTVTAWGPLPRFLARQAERACIGEVAAAASLAAPGDVYVVTGFYGNFARTHLTPSQQGKLLDRFIRAGAIGYAVDGLPRPLPPDARFLVVDRLVTPHAPAGHFPAHYDVLKTAACSKS